MNILSPKGEKLDNKLIDSLDSAAYSNIQSKPNIILLGDKKYNLKFKRAGSDDKPKNITTNNNENTVTKRISNFKGNTTGANNGISTNLNIPFKDKDKKYTSKPSVDKQYKSNKDNIILCTSLSSSNILLKLGTNKYNSRIGKKLK